jgi:hypothetical protein
MLTPAMTAAFLIALNVAGLTQNSSCEEPNVMFSDMKVSAYMPRSSTILLPAKWDASNHDHLATMYRYMARHVMITCLYSNPPPQQIMNYENKVVSFAP